jgi:hypothetical protein
MLTKYRKILILALLALLTACLLFADNLLLDSSKATTDAGSNNADMEMAALDTVKPTPKAKAAGVSKEVALKKKIEQIDKSYKTKLTTAKSEIASAGEVSEKTRGDGLKLAGDFKAALDELATWHEGHGGASRAKSCRAIGESRIASAEMAFNKIDGDKIDAANAKQDGLRSATKEYYADAKQDLSPEDRNQIKSSSLGKFQQIAGNVQQLVQTVMGLLSQVQSSASPAAMAGCAASAVSSGGNPADAAGALLMPLKSLLSLVKGMVTNVQDLISDINSL